MSIISKIENIKTQFEQGNPQVIIEFAKLASLENLLLCQRGFSEAVRMAVQNRRFNVYTPDGRLEKSVDLSDYSLSYADEVDQAGYQKFRITSNT